MNIIPTPLEGVLIIEPDVYHDQRGFFFETYQKERYQALGIVQDFVQDNISFSKKGTVRGLHFQITKPQAKLVQAITGEIFDVAVDIRPESATFGKWTGIILSEENRRQFLIPEGFAHGFAVLSDTALFSYKCSNYYKADDEGGILFSDPFIGIEWPVQNPILSGKDQKYPGLKDLEPEQLYLPG
ncbi:MAG: dTDP-4-dehydrorhamnose 3,5-epimerase [Proteobacteria bacterium]|nr:dTDP-4-dehydrorhamnose 3,5-epimerase [Pseudomonadota bacterium]